MEDQDDPDPGEPARRPASEGPDAIEHDPLLEPELVARLLRWTEPDIRPLPPPRGWLSRAGADILGRRRSRAVLHQLVDGDPLGLELLCAHRVETEAWLVDMTELVLASAAQVAHDADSFSNGAGLHTWLDARVRKALRSELERDFHDECIRRRAPGSLQVRFVFLSGLVGIDPNLGRRACVAFNALPLEDRRTFWAIRIDQQTIEHHAATWNDPPDLVRSRLRRVVEILVRVGRPDPPTDPEKVR